MAAQLLGVSFTRSTTLLDQIPFDKPPQALAERAREILGRAGRTGRPADRAYGFAYDRRFLQWIEDHDPSPERWRRLMRGQPAVVHFWYRESPRPMTPRNKRLIVTPSDPPLETGMAFVRLDTQGRLLELLAPADTPSSARPSDSPLWEDLLAEAGLDPAALRPAPEQWLPPVFADSVALFAGHFPRESAMPLRVELASHGGEPVAFRVRGPWDDPQQRAARPLGRAGVGAFTAMLVPVLLFALVLGRRNIRLGRSDRRGAFRLALFTFGCDLLYALLRYGHADSALGEWFLVADAAGEALFDAGIAWVLYVALEPFVRRRWPEALVSWSRILSGRFADQLVGRDILVAALAAGVSVALFALAQAAPGWRGRPAAPPLMAAYLDFLLGPSRQVAWLTGFVAVTAVVASLTVVLLFVLLKALVRHRAAAAAGLWLIYTSAFAFAVRPLPEELPFYAGMAAVVTWLVVRHGLLALALMYLFGALLLEPLATTNLRAWYGEPALLSYVLAAGLLGWGLYASLAGGAFGWGQQLVKSLER